MTMWVLVPVKATILAKSRLGGLLSLSERARLGRAMFEDVLRALRWVAADLQIAVLTDDQEVAAHAASAGCQVMPERGEGLNPALNRCARSLSVRGAGSLLTVPADLPSLQGGDIERLAAAHSAGVTVVPAIDGGTNVLLCSPPDVIELQFGDASAQRHVDAARAVGVDVRIIEIPNLLRDIDRPEDLSWLLANASPGATLDYLERSGIADRLIRGQESAR